MDLVAREAVVRGRVQGVYYRSTCRREASRRGLAGWARNEPDGTVRIRVEGPAGEVEDLLAWAREGSPPALVESVDVETVAPEGASGFEVC